MGDLCNNKPLTIAPVKVINLYSYKGLYFFTHKSKKDARCFIISELSTGMVCRTAYTEQQTVRDLVFKLEHITTEDFFTVVEKSLNAIKKHGLKKIPVNELTKEIKKYAEEIEL
jgi:hypothetical protein